MTAQGMHTLQEIQTQTDAWAAVVDAAREGARPWETFFAQRVGDLTLFFGCGSTHYLSLSAASDLLSHKTLLKRSPMALNRRSSSTKKGPSSLSGGGVI